jgi:hypothetical protein
MLENKMTIASTCMRLKGKLVLAGLALFLTGCTSGSMRREELVAFIEDADNGLRQEAQAGETRVEVCYLPTDIMVCQESGEQEVDTVKINGLKKKYAGYYYFRASFSRNNKEVLHQPGRGFDQYSDLVQNMSFRMPAYVNLTTDSDTIPLADFMLNRTFGFSNATEILLAFNKEKASGKESLQLNMKEFGLNIGNQRFHFQVNDLEHAPRIKFGK